MAKVITTTFQLRRGHAAWYEENNPVLAQGEPAFELDTNKLKIGDGVTKYNDLEYINKDLYYLSTASVNGNTLTLTNNSGETITFSVDDGEQIGKFGTGEKAEIHNDLENNIANGDYSFTEGTSSIKPFSLGTTSYISVNDIYWENEEGESGLLNTIIDFTKKQAFLPTFLTGSGIKLYFNNQELTPNLFPNHRFMLGDGYNKEIREAERSNYTNWIFINNCSQWGYYLTGDSFSPEDDPFPLIWDLNAPGGLPYIFVDQFNTANGECSHVEGAGNISYGDRGHIEGRHNEIKYFSNNSHIEGFGNIVNSGNSTHIEGERNLTIGSGTGIHIEGRANVAQGTYSHIEGKNNFAFGAYSHVGGYGTRYTIEINETIIRTTTKAENTSSIEINLPVDEANTSNFMPAPDTATNVLFWGIWYINKTKAIARRVGSMYKLNTKLRFSIRTIDAETITIDPTDDAYFYWGNSTYGIGAIAGGKENYAYGNYSIAIGQGTIARGVGQIALGKYNNIDDTSLLIIGKGTDVLNRADALTIAQNGDMTVNGNIISNISKPNKVIIGSNTTVASGNYSIALGNNSQATGANAVAIGTSTTGFTLASGTQSVALGNGTTASAKNSIAAGVLSIAEHDNSFTFGNRIQSGRTNSFSVGQYNEVDSKAIFTVGNGTSDSNRKNAFVVLAGGNIKAQGTIYSNNKEVATKEYVDNKPIVFRLVDLSKSYNTITTFSINGHTWGQIANDINGENPNIEATSFIYINPSNNKVAVMDPNDTLFYLHTDAALEIDIMATDTPKDGATYYFTIE